jgi:hypothetical protein
MQTKMELIKEILMETITEKTLEILTPIKTVLI